MKGSLIKSSLVIFALFLALFFLEGMLRILLPVPENLAKLKSSDLFLHENKPNATFSYERNGEYKNQIVFNSSGFRDEPFTTYKDPGVFRIAVLGDSQEEALQVEIPDTWEKVMARNLSDKLARKVESYSFGVSGYGTDQEWLTLREKVWQFSPDLVILAFSPNDVGDTFKNKLVEVVNGKLEVISNEQRAGGNFLGKFARQIYIYHYLNKAASANKFTKAMFDEFRTKILGFPKDERFFLSDAQLVEGPFEVVASKFEPPKEVLDTWTVIGALVYDMKSQADSHGAKFMITVNIPRAQVQPESWAGLKEQYHLTDENASPYQINEVMGAIAKDLGVPYHDGRLEAIDWEKRTGILHFPVDGHFNVNGNLFMGTKVADFILDAKLIN